MTMPESPSPSNPGASALKPQLPDRPGQARFWVQLYGSSRSLALAQAAETCSGPLLVIAADANLAAQLADELRFYRRDPELFPILAFPDWETLPYDQFSPYQDIVSERLSVLNRLAEMRSGVLVVPVSTAMHRLLPAEFLRGHSLRLAVRQRLDMERFRRDLESAGYRFVSQVAELGETAVRGSILDIFPMGAEVPYRIDLFDDEIDSIRIFDPESQLSSTQVDLIDILPAREVALTESGIARFRSAWRSRFSGNPVASPVYRDVSNGLAPAGIEYYLPLFYDSTQSLFEYMNDSACVVFDEAAREGVDMFWADVQSRYEQLRHDLERPLLSPAEMFYPPDQFFQLAGRAPQVRISGLATGSERAGMVNYATRAPLQLPIDARARDPVAALRGFVERSPGPVLLVAESAGRRETISELLARHDLRPAAVSGWREFLETRPPLALTTGALDRGAMLDNPHIAVVAESQLFGERAAQRRLRKHRRPDSDAIVRDLAELTIGAPVVHERHGVGRYLGLVTLTVGEIPGEFLCLEYEQGDKLYVPVASLELVSRYTGVDPEHAPLHRLGSGQWQKARRRAAERAFDVAAELLELHARRAARPGISFAVDDDAYYAFLQSFPFEETAGQAQAIEEVVQDMRQGKPMDRLICGDAGFGKTEVAMRATFLAVQNNRQVAVLVPTTLLGQQHFQNFRDRFAEWPVRIEVLSRFVSPRQQASIIEDLAAGKVDVVIGTHKLLQKGIRFARLGLVIIDEEHRFGVRQKEKLKSLRAEVDVLTLTATPIPRTLNMALSDLRDLSIISTPPSRRLAVKTFVREWNEPLIREALLREIKRGGQVYFLHNEVQSIQDWAGRVESLAPEATVRVAHGQMPERELERVMLDFYHRRFNVLVCTTIIETGIDVPTANTIVINRADKFGLAQLYQLRGRVGRSHHRAYAYLMVPPRGAISRDAVKRLEAIESLEDLGIGFTLAIHDLEIRGAGEILGDEQSGQIQEIGYSMYMDLLERAVRTLKRGDKARFDETRDQGTEIELHVPALIPSDYLPDVHARLILYKRIAGTRDGEELDSLVEEIIDRFGPLPEPLRNLVRVTGLKQRARMLGIQKIDLGRQGGRVHFCEKPSIDPTRVIELVRSGSGTYQFDGRDKLRISKELSEPSSRFDTLIELFEQIQSRDAA